MEACLNLSLIRVALLWFSHQQFTENLMLKCRSIHKYVNYYINTEMFIMFLHHALYLLKLIFIVLENMFENQGIICN